MPAVAEKLVNYAKTIDYFLDFGSREFLRWAVTIVACGLRRDEKESRKNPALKLLWFWLA